MSSLNVVQNVSIDNIARSDLMKVACDSQNLDTIGYHEHILTYDPHKPALDGILALCYFQWKGLSVTLSSTHSGRSPQVDSLIIL